ncbi:MAG: toll/interleukin-1 receptor domain-containing protein [Cyanobacteria bacterium J06627_8]
MANEKQLAILRQGVEAWNRWRQENPDVKIDLSRADLSVARLYGVDLNGANLRGADLSYADLSVANLTGAYLNGANLNDANLTGAYLNDANLTGAYLNGAGLGDADLNGANLTGANLAGAYLTGADLGGANLGNAILGETIFGNVNLTTVKGLDSCRHYGPSVVDFRTLSQSKNLPLSFLRGVGLPDVLIDYLPSLTNQPLQFYSVFISYSSKDQEFVERLYADLQNKGVRCWYAPEDLPIGEKIRVGIDEAIRIHDKLLLVLSEASVNSQWVEQEVETALEKERQQNRIVLFPIRVDEAVMESCSGWASLIKKTRNVGNFCEWKSHDSYQKGLTRLLRDLKPKEIG